MNNKNISNGIPNKDVIALIGRIVGFRTVFETISEITSKKAPIIVEEINKYFGDFRFNSLAIWGAIKPMKPIIPTIETVVDANNEHISKNKILSKLTFTPCITAFLSPCWMIPKSLEKSRDIPNAKTRITNRIAESFILATVKDPVVQNVIW